MIGVTLAALAVALVALGVFGRLLARERHEHTRAEQRWEKERARLIDQLCHLTDKPWTPPPREPVRPAPERAPDPDDELVNW